MSHQTPKVSYLIKLHSMHRCKAAASSSGASLKILSNVSPHTRSSRTRSNSHRREFATTTAPHLAIADVRHEIETQQHLLKVYHTMCERSGLSRDEHQIRSLAALDRLRNELEGLGGAPSADTVSNNNNNNNSNNNTAIGDEERSDAFSSSSDDSNISSEGGFLRNLFSHGASAKAISTGLQPTVPKGVYLHGGVGCGKTFCMDLFYKSIAKGRGIPRIKAQKVHFHSFMLEQVHKQMHEAKMIEGVKGDVMPRVIERILDEGKVICFDEFQVTDVADALILRRLFTGLLDSGAIIIATSNRPPRDLYLNGLQRDRFIPFIDLLEEKLEIISMWESDTDYRLIQGEDAVKGVYFVGESSLSEFEHQFQKLSKGEPIGPTSLTTQGRLVPVPIASLEQGVARFNFDDLCRKALGAADYLVIAANFHTVFVEGVPALTMNDINVVRRLITFVDCFYEANVKLILQLETPPKDIFTVDLDNANHDEAFAFDRTRSRLEEMGSKEYLQKGWHGRMDELADD